MTRLPPQGIQALMEVYYYVFGKSTRKFKFTLGVHMYNYSPYWNYELEMA